MPREGRAPRVLLGLAAGTLLGVGSGTPTPLLAYDVVPLSDGGTLTGSVKFVGTPPRLDLIPVRKNRDACGPSVANEALVLGPNQGVKGSVILIEGVSRGKKADAELILDNTRCLFVPHVAGVMAGAPVKIRNSDTLMHNAHGFLGAQPLFNSALSFKGRTVDVTGRLKQPGVAKVLCDVHTHMTAWLVIHDSPYFAVTDDQGMFKIDGIPPGTYTVTMWHEGFAPKGTDKDGRPLYEERRVGRAIIIPPGGSATVEFELR